MLDRTLTIGTPPRNCILQPICSLQNQNAISLYDLFCNSCTVYKKWDAMSLYHPWPRWCQHCYFYLCWQASKFCYRWLYHLCPRNCWLYWFQSQWEWVQGFSILHVIHHLPLPLAHSTIIMHRMLTVVVLTGILWILTTVDAAITRWYQEAPRLGLYTRNYSLDSGLGTIPFKIVLLCSDTSLPAQLPLLERLLEILFSKRVVLFDFWKHASSHLVSFSTMW